jgi:hypothetical protein
MRTALAFAACVIIGSACAWGQVISTAQITGTVADSSGAPVPGADVTATQVATGLVRTVVTAPDGSYVLTNLPVGPYQLEVKKDNFAKYVQGGIILQVGSDPRIEVVLKVGAVSDSIEVQADPSLVETRNAGFGQVIDNQRVLDLPLNGRESIQLMYLSGIVTPAGGTSQTQPGGTGVNSGLRNYPTLSISVAGGIDNGTTYSLDGGTHNDPYNNYNEPLPFPDALQEFKVETSGLSAQYGFHSAAAVNAVTKSGNNSFHGDLFEFIRNGATNARNAFASVVDPLKRNQFGGTLGGPIRKNKLFFFIAEQTTIQRDVTNNNIEFVPTAQMLAGNFTTITSPQCNTAGKQINLPAPFVNNTISPTLFSQPAIKILSLPGFPTSTNPCGEVEFGRKNDSDEEIAVSRVDYQKSDKHSLFVRYLAAHLVQPSDANPTNLLAGDLANLNFLVQSTVLGDTYVIGPGTVSSFRATLNRNDIPKTNPTLFDASDVGINMWVGVPGYLKISMTNGFNVGSSSGSPSVYNSLVYQFAEDMNLVRGKHQIGFGVNYIHSILNANSGTSAAGSLSFTGQVTGLSLADFMIGQPASLSQGMQTLIYPRSDYVGSYVQDTWKATSRLTLSYGVRWEPYLPVYSKQNEVFHFDPTLFTEGVHSAQYVNAPAGLIYPGDPGYPGNRVAESRWNNFGPRVAIAWDPQGNGKTAIRAAYGIFYDPPDLDEFTIFAQSPPFGSTTTVNFPASLANPWQNYPGGDPFPGPGINKNSPYVTSGTYENWLLNSKTPYAQQWNLSIQRQVGANWLVQANYLGSGFRHLSGSNEENPGVYIPGSCVINGVSTNPCSTTANVNSRRVLYLQNPSQGQYFADINQLDAGGTASYNALVLAAQHRSAKGYTIQATYTWSHCISTPVNYELGGVAGDFMVPNDRDRDRGNCPGSDRRQQFNLSAVYQTPRFADPWVRRLVSGWELSSIVRLLTGPYIQVLSGLDQALTGLSSVERPNQVLADPYTANRSLNQYLNPAAFAQPALGTYGDLGDYNILSPGAIYIDMGLSRTLRIKEGYNLQFRFEAFNVPNHLNPGTPTGISGTAGLVTPSVALNNANFGKILSADDPRILQGALKFIF